MFCRGAIDPLDELFIPQHPLDEGRALLSGVAVIDARREEFRSLRRQRVSDDATRVPFPRAILSKQACFAAPRAAGFEAPPPEPPVDVSHALLSHAVAATTAVGETKTSGHATQK